ncbi:hypothetical protein [Sandaracinus amylolyticus]|uniref:hypothetical protein n=1 Tax=Sandaracinus amylolyticus TaxID=927083 RepID=UPI001F334539|nr:hypothetical protein [Sandaracinus amylolyticus]UJR84146.1 Hypothetical protein I5071_62170 [Sandaracinus amylolyticus]
MSAAPAELPDVFQGELDGALFEALFDDLARFATIESVHLKSGPDAHADETPITLDKARLLLVLGSVHGVRIRYQHEGVEWIDTILRGRRALRLVRLRVPGARPKRRLQVVR